MSLISSLKRHLGMVLIGTFFVSMTMTGGLIGYWTMVDISAPYVTVTEHTIPYNFERYLKGEYVPAEKVSAGDMVLVRREFCVTEQSSGVVSRVIIDGVQLPLQPLDINTPVGCYDQLTPIKIPEFLPKGPYVYRERITYKVNPLTESFVELPDVSFVIE